MDLEQLKIIALALLAGFMVGIIFTALKLPLPAPPHIAGIAGIVGVFVGYKCWLWVFDAYFKSQ